MSNEYWRQSRRISGRDWQQYLDRDGGRYGAGDQQAPDDRFHSAQHDSGESQQEPFYATQQYGHPPRDQDRRGQHLQEDSEPHLRLSGVLHSQDAEEPSLLSGISGIGSVDTELLSLYCANAFRPADATAEAEAESNRSWDPVRMWLRSRTEQQILSAIEYRAESSTTALHIACRNGPPQEIIHALLSIAPHVAQWQDRFGWVPLHYACACSASEDVVKSLMEAFPQSMSTLDRRGRTPLHFAVGPKHLPPEVIVLLASTGAAECVDGNGYLPLHYACAHGVSEEVVYALTNANPAGIAVKERNGRTPLHFTLANAGRKAAPAIVCHLLSLNRELVNSVGGAPLPLRVLADRANHVSWAEKTASVDQDKESITRCLEYLLVNQHPDPPAADYFIALQSLPDWLSEQAVVMPVVQALVNEKIAQRFPTAVRLLDWLFLISTLLAYSFRVPDAIRRRVEDETSTANVDLPQPTEELLFLYIAVVYFSLREFLQVISLTSIDSFHLWLHNPSSWLNLAFIFVVFFWTISMDFGLGGARQFRIGVVTSLPVLWAKVFVHWKSLDIDYSVFVSGVFNVLRRLAAFFVVSVITLVAFAQMFTTIFRQSEYCINQPNDSLSEIMLLADTRCDQNQIRSYCNLWPAFLGVFTMMLGDVSETDFESSEAATIMFAIFMLLVVILLANVLIAVVTESYKAIQDRRASIVYWTNRLHFVAELDAIANGLLWSCGRIRRSPDNDQHIDYYCSQAVWGKEYWKQIMELFEYEIDADFWSLDYMGYALERMVALIIIPAWFSIGLVSLGILWPPQIREAFSDFSVYSKRSTAAGKQKCEEDLLKARVEQLGQEAGLLKDGLLQELAMDRTQAATLKTQVTRWKADVSREMKDMKRIVTALFEQHSAT